MSKFDKEIERQKKLLAKMTAKEMIDEMSEIHSEIVKMIWNSRLTPVLMFGVLEEVKEDIRMNLEEVMRVLKE